MPQIEITIIKENLTDVVRRYGEDEEGRVFCYVFVFLDPNVRMAFLLPCRSQSVCLSVQCLSHNSREGRRGSQVAATSSLRFISTVVRDFFFFFLLVEGKGLFIQEPELSNAR